MRNFVQPGNAVTIPSPVTLAAGDPVVVGALRGVANGDAETGEPVVIATTGIFELDKVGADAFAVGDLAYVDGAGLATVADTGSEIGVAVRAAAAGSAKVFVRVD